MPNPFCLIPQHADDLLARVKSGELSGEKLAKMTSEERRSKFAEIVGETNAEKVNASFESRLLLKNQQAAIKTWIDKAKDLTPAAKRDLLSRVERMDAVLHPKTSKDFLADIAKQRLGFGVTAEEAGKITAMAKEVSDATKANDFDAAMTARAKFNAYTGELKGRDPLSAARAVSAFVRASVLSWPTVLVKLTAAALGRAAVTPIEDVIATGVSKALPKLAEGAPRYGSASLDVARKAEAAGQAAMWTKGMQDAGRVLMNKPSQLSLMHGEGTVPAAWYEYPGAIHAALKTPVKWGEYARSLYRRTADAMARGEDTKDMTVKMRLSTEAFKDAQRAVFMNDNKVSTGWNNLLRTAESVDKETGRANPAGVWLAAVARSEMPIVKVPTNIVVETSHYIDGMLVGPARAAWAYAHGIEDLKPVERDAIIRQISKGAVGSALMLLYYFKHDQVEVGGYYQEGEHRKPNAVPAMGMRVNGVDIPKQLLDVPAVQAAQFAATVGHVYGTRVNKAGDTNGVTSSLTAAALGLIDEVPIIGTPRRDFKALEQPSTRADFLPNKVANLAVPGIVQWVARKTDPEDQPRKAMGFAQHLEANIPGLRKNVPLKKVRR